MGPWSRWTGLTARERRLRWRALAVLAAVRVATAFLPFAAVRGAVERAARGAGGADPGSADRAVRSAARVVPGATCLVRALAALALLGPEARLVLGVGRDASGEFTAHAWVECADGSLVGDRGDPALLAIPVREPAPWR